MVPAIARVAAGVAVVWGLEKLDSRLNPLATRSPLRLAVLRLGLTEPAWSSPLNYGKREGEYVRLLHVAWRGTVAGQQGTAGG